MLSHIFNPYILNNQKLLQSKRNTPTPKITGAKSRDRCCGYRDGNNLRRDYLAIFHKSLCPTGD